jgi:RNA-dependent RNA polymerase
LLIEVGLELAALHSKAVDYVKTGEPAEIKKGLIPRQWPHFMEKKYKSKEAQYHSRNILGQLYDRVEIIEFVPQYTEPFDKRILSAYQLDDALLKSAREVKTKYDTAMKRLLAQQEIGTEFEIWTAFVLSRPRVGSDYKVQEEIARLSDALKDQFRALCIEKAGSRDFSILGPFVAGMYKTTKEELDIALAECSRTKVVGDREVPVRRMEPRFMPLISFPWLFEKELGRIATGMDGEEELEDLGLTHLTFNEPTRGHKHRGGAQATEEDLVLHVGGDIIHRGEDLVVFPPDSGYENEGGSDDYEGDKGWDEYDVVRNKFSKAVLDTDVRRRNDRSGVEDVVSRMELDGLLGPLEKAEISSPSTALVSRTVDV